MRLSVLYALIRKFEGLRLKPYLCPAGVATIGYGHTGGVTLKTPPITPDEAEALMVADAEMFAIAALKLSPCLASATDKHSAVADFCFNLGMSRYKASTLRRKVNQGDWDAAGDELMKWVWGGGKRLPGLILRRVAERSLLYDI